MADIDLSKYKDLFLKTAREYISKLAASTPTLAQNANNAELIEELHIAAHSLKGQSLAMGYTSLGNVALLLEHTFRDAKDNTGILTPPLIDTMTRAVGRLSESINSIDISGHEIDLAPIAAELQSLHQSS